MSLSLPQWVPMLPQSAADPFDDSAWQFEPKLDGMRQLAFVESGQPTRLVSRRGVDSAADFPWLTAALEALPCRDVILDQELVALDHQGRVSFSALQNRRNSPGQLTAYAFDVLWLDGENLCGRPLVERQAILGQLVPDTTTGPLRRVVGVRGNGRALYAAVCAAGLEGIVAKRASSRYEPGRRSPNWLKIKPVRRDEFVIGGYTPGTGARSDTFGALVLGYYPAGADRLRYVGRVGTGFDGRTMSDLLRVLRPLHAGSAFDGQPAPTPGPRAPGPIQYVRPELVAEVAYQERSSDGMLRFPSFMGLREDKTPREAGPDQNSPAA